MSDYNSTATSTVKINGREAIDELDRLKRKAKDLEDAILRATNAGNKADLAKFKREFRSTKAEINRVESAVHGVEAVMRRLDKATPQELKNTLKQLNWELKRMERGSQAWDNQCDKIKRVKAEIDKVNNDLRTHESWLSRVNKKINTWGMAVAGAMAATMGVVMSARKAFEAYAEMDQEMANVRKFTGMTEQQVAGLNEEFKKIDTRSSREALNKLAQDAGRLGKGSKEDVLGFVRAADQINVALDDLGDGATLTLSKLTGIFGVEKEYGTEKSLLKVGSVINELSQNCAASAPYLAEFDSRVGGVGAQAGLTIPQISGFGAVLDSNNQKLEASSTALSQVITRVFQDPAKYAKVAGIEVGRFSKLVKTDMNAALIELLEHLNKAGGMDTLAPMFKDMGENGARAISALSTLAGHIDEVKKQQAAANVAFREGTSVSKEFNVQNNTVQAELDKAKKGFSELAIALGQKLAPVMRYAITGTSAMMRVLSSVIGFIMRHRTAILSLAAAMAAYTVAVKAATIMTKAHAAATLAVKVAQEAWIAVQALASAAFSLFTGKVHAATQGFRIFSATLKANPIGLVVAAITAAIVAMAGFVKKINDNIRRQRELRHEMERYKDSIRDISQATANYAEEETRRLKTIYDATQDNNLKMKERIDKVRELQRLYPSYFGQMSTESILAGNAAKKYQELTQSIINAAKARAAADKIKENYSAIIELETANAQFGASERVKKAELNDLIHRIGLQKADSYRRNRKITSGPMGGFVSEGQGGAGSFMTESDANAANFHKEELASLVSDVGKLRKQLAGNRTKIKLLEESNVWLKKTYGVKDEQIIDRPVNQAANVTMPYSARSGAQPSGKSSRGDAGAKDKFQKEKDWKEREEALNRIAYATGLKNYEQYTDRMQEISAEFYKMELEHTDLGENERLGIHAQYNEALAKMRETAANKTIEQENRDYAQLQAQVQQDYLDDKISYEAYSMQMESIEFAHLRALTEITKQGTAERTQAEKDYRQKLVDQQKRQQDKTEKAEKAHKDKLEEVWEKYFVGEKEKRRKVYEETKKAIKQTYLLKKAAMEAEGKDTSELTAKYEKAMKRLEEEYNKSELAMDRSLTDWVIHYLGKAFGEENIKKIDPFLKSALASISSAYQSVTQMMQAESELQVAAIERRYEREMSMAEGNSYKLKELEKRKQREIAKVKNAAQRKQFSMQVIQAVAQTATAALNAYSSAAAIPIIGHAIAPVAAALATAAGMLQVAAIKKQAQASAAQGYAAGGFTRPGRREEVAGVVHAGEWVASQQLVQSPVARPMIDALEYAQRNNTIGSLKPAEVSRAITAPAALASGLGDNAEKAVAALAFTMERYSGTMKRLNDRLNEPFVTVNTVTGDDGINQAQEEYRKLMNNATSKRKRK